MVLSDTTGENTTMQRPLVAQRRRGESPWQLAGFAGGVLAFGALCGAAAVRVWDQSNPQPKKKGIPGSASASRPLVSPSATAFALKAFGAGFALPNFLHHLANSPVIRNTAVPILCLCCAVGGLQEHGRILH